MSDLTPEDIYRTQIVHLLPLLPFTKGGTQRKIIEEMFERLNAVEEREASLVGFQIASFVLKRSNPSELDWLQRRYRAMHDILRDSPVYEWILNEGREEGRNEGKTLAMRSILENIVKIHFPNLLPILQQKLINISNPQVLEEAILNISSMQDEREVHKLIRNLKDPS